MLFAFIHFADEQDSLLVNSHAVFVGAKQLLHVLFYKPYRHIHKTKTTDSRQHKYYRKQFVLREYAQSVLTCGDADFLIGAALRTANQRQVVRQDVLEKLVSSQSTVSHVLPATWRESRHYTAAQQGGERTVSGSYHLQSSSLQVPVRSNRQKHFFGSMVLLYVTELRDNFSLVL